MLLVFKVFGHKIERKVTEVIRTHHVPNFMEIHPIVVKNQSSINPLALEEKLTWIAKVIRMNACTQFQGNPLNSCRDVSVEECQCG